MQTFIEAFEAGTKERERLEYEWNILQETGNSARMESAVEELQQAKKRGYLPLASECGGRYLVAADDFIVGGAGNCSYLLFCAGLTKVDPLRFHLPFERFLNPLMGERVEIPLVARRQRHISPEEVDFSAILIEKGYFGEEILMPLECSGAAEEILRETNGHLVFQEQAMRLLHEIGGFSYADADMVRRELAKGHFQGDGKCVEEPFFDRAKARGSYRKEAQKILSEIAERSGKLLPKCALLGELLN